MAKLVVDQVDLAGKRVFLRADFNVPLEGARVTDDTRITAVLPTMSCCLDRGASLVLASHLGRPKGKPDPKYSLGPVAERLQTLLERPVTLLPDCVGPEVEERARALRPGEVVLLENLRYHAEEEANDEEFARSLAALADVYVDDAFAASHRAHASIAAITRFLKPAAAGLLMARELDALARIFERPDRPIWAVLGGAKVSDKLGLVEHLLGRVDGLAIGFDDFATNEPVIDAILPGSIGDSDLLHRDSIAPPGAMPAFSNGFRPAHSVGTARRFGPEK